MIIVTVIIYLPYHYTLNCNARVNYKPKCHLLDTAGDISHVSYNFKITFA